MSKHAFLVELETTKEIPDLEALIAGRIYTLDGVDVSADVKVSPVVDGEHLKEGAQ